MHCFASCFWIFCWGPILKQRACDLGMVFFCYLSPCSKSSRGVKMISHCNRFGNSNARNVHMRVLSRFAIPYASSFYGNEKGWVTHTFFCFYNIGFRGVEHIEYLGCDMMLRIQSSFWQHAIALFLYPICSMYGIFTYIWVIFWVNVGKYSLHGANWYLMGNNIFRCFFWRLVIFLGFRFAYSITSLLFLLFCFCCFFAFFAFLGVHCASLLFSLFCFFRLFLLLLLVCFSSFFAFLLFAFAFNAFPFILFFLLFRL